MKQLNNCPGAEIYRISRGQASGGSSLLSQHNAIRSKGKRADSIALVYSPQQKILFSRQQLGTGIADIYPPPPPISRPLNLLPFSTAHAVGSILPTPPCHPTAPTKSTRSLSSSVAQKPETLSQPRYVHDIIVVTSPAPGLSAFVFYARSRASED
jgi:hypothetical protein